ncbi:hypothetical protein CNYM01_04380 [Colletotrichum nymphaeae SA-01]|uniref:Uncharacterized protein n=1 Tax=Colletotrichum nymphaeae SA-01 TaxID=1460502 RepID=A0A135RTS0_9PEZI|nr:hypothetical protein CNYM01_04380 [Colletotrichum nymphaeae SA-01]
MPDFDIRDAPGGCLAQDGFLRSAWPLSDAGNDATHDKDLSGFYCLVVMTRLINHSLSAEDRRGPLRETEESITKFMSLAWHSAGAPELIEEFIKEVMSLEFVHLVDMETMNATLWSRPEHLLFDYVTSDTQGDTRVDNEKGNVVEASYIRVKGHPQKIDEAIRDKAGKIERQPDGTHGAFFPQPPTYVRVLYEPSEGDEIHPLKSFQVVNVRDLRPEEDPIDDGVDRTLHRYVLITAVRLRAKQTDHDCIRTFSLDGTPIEPQVTAPYANTTWQVGSPGHRYFLLYQESRLPLYDLEDPKNRVFPRMANGEQIWGQMRSRLEQLKNRRPWVPLTGVLNGAGSQRAREERHPVVDAQTSQEVIPGAGSGHIDTGGHAGRGRHTDAPSRAAEGDGPEDASSSIADDYLDAWFGRLC